MFRELEVMYSQEEERYLDTSSAFFWHVWNSFTLDKHTANRLNLKKNYERVENAINSINISI
jgi:hypothetical protein